MQIIIRGQKVKTQLISKSLANIVKDKYKPNFLNVSNQSYRSKMWFPASKQKTLYFTTIWNVVIGKIGMNFLKKVRIVCFLNMKAHWHELRFLFYKFNQLIKYIHYIVCFL